MRYGHLCLVHQILMNWCCTPSIGWYVNQTGIRLGKRVWMYIMWSNFLECFFQCFMCVFLWLFVSTIKLRQFLPICWFFTCYSFKMASKIQNNAKFTKEQEMFANWTIGGAQHQFNKNWWTRHKCPYLMNI